MATSAPDPIAIYGAALATLVAAWNFYTWWINGPKIVGSAAPNMKIFGSFPVDDNTYVSLTVSNRGNAETTITNVGTLAYISRWNFLRNKSAKAAVVNHSTYGYPLPYKLGPGHEFRSLAKQEDLIVTWSKDYLLYMCIWHSMSDKPVRFRVRPIDVKQERLARDEQSGRKSG